MAIYEMYLPTEDYLMIKFDSMIRTDTLINDNFTVTNDSHSTVTNLVNPFKTIELLSDYHSISRTLYLWWNITLEPGDTYSIHIKNLLDVFDQAIEEDTITFEVEPGATPNTPTADERPTREPVDVEDYSIKVIPSLTGTTLEPDADAFSVVSVTPEADSAYYLGSDENNGKIAVEFTQLPAANFINSSDFRLQKKLIGSGISKWTNVDTVVAAESTLPIVNIYLPSQDATPVYSYMVEDDEERVYWEPSYKYRLVLSKSIGF